MEDEEEEEERVDGRGLLETGRHHEWPSAQVLRAFIRRYPALVRHRRVLELGSGLGTCGVAAAEAGAAEVVFTDAEEARPVLAKLRSTAAELCRRLAGSSGQDENARDSGAEREEDHSDERQRFRACGFTWGRFPSYLLEPNPAPKVLLAADCLYDSTQYEDFVASVSFLLHRDPDAILLMTYHIRSESRTIGSLLRRYGLVACLVPLESFMDEEDIESLSANIEVSLIQAQAAQRTALTALCATSKLRE